MRKIRLKQPVTVMGVGTIPEGTQFKVDKYNKRFVYVTFIGCQLRLSRILVEKIY